MEKTALISVILPVSNAARFLPECLKSLFSQTYKNIEIIAVDDASKDSSFKVLKNSKKKDKRLKVFKNVKKYGISVCLNRALKKTRGDFIAFMGQNDICLPQRLSKQISYLKNNPKVAVLGSQFRGINKKSELKGKSRFPTDPDIIRQTHLLEAPLKFETLMVNKTILPKDILKFPARFQAFKNSAADAFYIDALLKILPYADFANLNEYLYKARILSTSSLKRLSISAFIKSFQTPIKAYFIIPEFSLYELALVFVRTIRTSLKSFSSHYYKELIQK